jgi:M-phase inducer tyrosine phosphatase
MSLSLRRADFSIPLPDLQLSPSPKLRSLSQDSLFSYSGSPFETLNPSALRALIQNRLPGESVIIIDARFDYEFAGGHINGAMNVRSIADMKAFFQQFQECQPSLVFHCEFSKSRGPTRMRHFREHDRQVNLEHYPTLTYPTIYLLEGGYSQFYRECPDLCTGGYVTMRDPTFVSSGDLRKSHSSYFADGLGEVKMRPRMQRTFSNVETSPAFDCDLQKVLAPRAVTPKPFTGTIEFPDL